MVALNPFGSHTVTRESEAQHDVATIHDADFRRLVVWAEQARKENCGIGVVLWGEPGIGKSHILMRLAQHAAASKTRSCFVYLYNLHSSVDRLPGFILSCVVRYLVKNKTSDLRNTTLYSLVEGFVRKAQGEVPPVSDAGKSFYESLRITYNRFIDKFAAQDSARALSYNRPVYNVLFSFFQSAHEATTRVGDEGIAAGDEGIAALALRWLAGDMLEPQEARQLGVRMESGNQETDSAVGVEHVKGVLFALTQMAALLGLPFLLCFDQIDILPPDRLTALSGFLHELIDNAANLLVITSGVQHRLLKLVKDGTIAQASWHRISHYSIALKRISTEDGRLLLRKRLEGFLQEFLAEPSIKVLVGRDPLFPLGTPWFKEYTKDLADLGPRELILRASERWQSQQELLQSKDVEAWLNGWVADGPRTGQPRPALSEAEIRSIIDEKTKQEIEAKTADRMQNQHTLPPDADSLANLVHDLLEDCVKEPERYQLSALERVPQKGKIPPHDLLLRRQGRGDSPTRLGARFLAEVKATCVTYALRRLVEARDNKQAQLLVTDDRLGWDLRGGVGRQHYQTLTSDGHGLFQHLRLKFEDYARVDALSGVIAMAKSGDLQCELPDHTSYSVTEAEVLESHHRQDRYLTSPLLRTLLLRQDAPPPPAGTPAIGDPQLRDFVLGRLALTMGMSSAEMAGHFVAAHPQTALDLSAVKARIEQIAHKLYDEKRIHVTPRPDGISMLLRP